MAASRAFLLALALVAAPLSGLAVEPAIVVIVHPSRTEELSREEVARIFLKQRRYWADGHPIVPLNREAQSASRELFRERVLLLDPGRLAEYWSERYFEGVLPPVTLSSDTAVVRYVAADPNAVGYVTSSHLDDSVRVAFRLP